MPIQELSKVVHDKFYFLTPTERELLLSYAQEITLAKDEILFQQGDPTDSFF